MEIQKIIDIVRETDKIFFDNKLRGDVKEKAKFDYVTRADTGISEYLHKRLDEEFPEIGFMSEEEKVSDFYGKDFWILDPIDGTTNFMHGIEPSAVSLGLCSDGEMIAGVIYIPYKNEIYSAVKGEGAFLNGKPIKVSENLKLENSLAAIELNAYFKNDVESAMNHMRKIYLNCQDVRVYGCAAGALAYVACGKLDAFLGRYLKPWDYAAGLVIISEAGGKVGDLNGKIKIQALNRHIIASNSFVYNELENLLKG